MNDNTGGARSDSELGINSSRHTGELVEKFKKYYETVKDKVVTFMKERTGRQNIAEAGSKKDQENTVQSK